MTFLGAVLGIAFVTVFSIDRTLSRILKEIQALRFVLEERPPGAPGPETKAK